MANRATMAGSHVPAHVGEGHSAGGRAARREGTLIRLLGLRETPFRALVAAAASLVTEALGPTLVAVRVGGERAVVADGRFLDAVACWLVAVARRVAPSQQVAPGDAAGAGAEHLTPRELQVCALIARGGTNAEIAAALALTPGTVANAIVGIRAKLGLKNRVGIAAWAIEHGLAGLDLRT